MERKTFLTCMQDELSVAGRMDESVAAGRMNEMGEQDRVIRLPLSPLFFSSFLVQINENKNY